LKCSHNAITEAWQRDTWYPANASLLNNNNNNNNNNIAFCPKQVGVG
jgi:hypothetical protein